MSRLEIILSCLLFLSLIFNVGVFVYARAAIVKLLWVAEELYDLKDMSDSLTEHLQSVYELEMFYGDETLGNLLRHSKSLVEECQKFQSIIKQEEEYAEEED